MSVNKVILIGHLGNNPDIRYTPGGAAVGNFSVATNENWVDKGGQKQEKTEWHRIVVWGKLAQLCGEYLVKGRQVYLEGRLQTRQWQDKEGQTKYTTEVIANTVQFLGAGTGAGTGANKGANYATAAHDGLATGHATTAQEDGATLASAGATVMEQPSFTDEDIPF